MKRACAPLVLAAVLAAAPPAPPLAAARGEDDPRPVSAAPELPHAPKGSLNGWVLRTMHGYPLDGSCGYHWPAPGSDPWEGTTVSLVYDGVQLTRGDAQRRSYCCGLTFEVYVRALLAANGGAPVAGLPAKELHELRLRFFGDSATKERRKLVQYGIESLGLGRAIERLEDARAGDFVQFWRHRGSGHSAIFVNWARKNGEIVGLTYWSSQSSTQGIGYHTEPVGPEGIDRAQIYLARADWPLDAASRKRRAAAQRR